MNQLAQSQQQVHQAEKEREGVMNQLAQSQQQVHQLKKEQEGVMYQRAQSQQQIHQLENEREAGERHRIELQKQIEASKLHGERERRDFEARERELQTREHDFLRQKSEAEVSLQEAEKKTMQEIEQRAAELREQKPRLVAAEKEVKRLQGVVQEQKLLLWKCESIHKAEISAQQIVSPGEAQKILRCREESAARERNKLTAELLEKAEKVACLEGCVGNVLRFLEERHIRVEELKGSRFLCDNVEEIDNAVLRLR